MTSCVRDARQHFGPVHILINNAGQAASAKFTDTDEALWNKMIAVNLNGTYLCSRQAVPDMSRPGTAASSTSRVSPGLRGAAYISAYVSSKHAVIGLTRSLALEIATRNITVNAVCPGYRDTDIVRSAVANIVRKTGRSEARRSHALIATQSAAATDRAPRGSCRHRHVAVRARARKHDRPEHRSGRRRSDLRRGKSCRRKELASNWSSRTWMPKPASTTITTCRCDCGCVCLSCTNRIENFVRQNLQARLRHHAAALRPDGAARARAAGPEDERAVATDDGTGGNVTGITDGLEKEGLVVREVDPADRRVFRVKLTAEGQKQFRRMAAEHEQWIIELFDGMSRSRRTSSPSCWASSSRTLPMLPATMGDGTCPQPSTSPFEPQHFLWRQEGRSVSLP